MKTLLYVRELHRAEFWRESLNDAPDFELALHTREPLGDRQSDKELNLPGYARIRVPRDITGWNILKTRVINATTLIFKMTGGDGAKITHLSIGIDGQMRMVLPLVDPLTVPPVGADSVTVIFKQGDISVAEFVADEPPPESKPKPATTKPVSASASVVSGGSRATARGAIRSD